MRLTPRFKQADIVIRVLTEGVEEGFLEPCQ